MTPVIPTRDWIPKLLNAVLRSRSNAPRRRVAAPLIASNLGAVADGGGKPWLSGGWGGAGKGGAGAGGDTWAPTASRWDALANGGKGVHGSDGKSAGKSAGGKKGEERGRGAPSDASVHRRRREGLLMPAGGETGAEAGPCVMLVAGGAGKQGGGAWGGGAAGWDVVVPWEWARVFWMALVRGGGRAIG